jgi:hypothetical protein
MEEVKQAKEAMGRGFQGFHQTWQRCPCAGNIRPILSESLEPAQYATARASRLRHIFAVVDRTISSLSRTTLELFTSKQPHPYYIRQVRASILHLASDQLFSRHHHE